MLPGFGMHTIRIRYELLVINRCLHVLQNRQLDGDEVFRMGTLSCLSART